MEDMAVLLAPGDGFLADGFGVCELEKGSDEWVALGTWWEMPTSWVLRSESVEDEPGYLMECVTLIALGTTMKYIVNRRSIGVVAINPSLMTKEDCQVAWTMSRIVMVVMCCVKTEKMLNHLKAFLEAPRQ